ARLASGRVTALTGWVLNPLDSFSEFQVWLFRHLSQRSRLCLAPRCSSFSVNPPQAFRRKKIT
ncbi:MAG: hypothetical protein ABIN18_03670, partial [Pseudomonadota bacterium]